MDPISLLIGFCIGIVGVAIAIELAWKKAPPLKTCNLTTRWDLEEMKNPMIVAERLSTKVPKGAKVVGNEIQIPSDEVEIRKGDARGNFAIGKERALIFTGEIKDGEFALWTTDDSIIKKLKDEFYRLWRKGEKERAALVRISKIKEMENVPIKTRGIIRAIVPYRDNFLYRLSDGGYSVGVLVKEKKDLIGKRVEVKGELKGRMVEAEEIVEL
jgi:hypothetical protein